MMAYLLEKIVTKKERKSIINRSTANNKET